MFLFFEEDGAYKAGTELSSTDASSQVELVTGKRVKIKRSHILLSFSSPSPTDFMRSAQAISEEIDIEMLWEFAPEEEFDFKSAAKDYFGDSVTTVQEAATLLRLFANPVYFYRKGRGKFRKAPEETLKLALAALEKRKRLDEQKKQYVAEFVENGKAPEAIARGAIQLLVRPDKNSIEWKALQEASDKLGLTPLKLLLQTGAIANPWRWHVESFFKANFPKGREFPDNLPIPGDMDLSDLPQAEVVAFSIDDSETTEIDDALSVTELADGRLKFGIHISAPSTGIAYGSEVDKAARERMSTLYAPGLKTTMLPERWIKAFSLDAGREVPVLSLYAIVDGVTQEVLATETRLEKLKVADNLRYENIEKEVTEEAVSSGNLNIAYGQEITRIWKFAKALLKKREEVRGRPEPKGRIDWYFSLKGKDENAQIELKGRKRGDPLDVVVAEMMIFANSTWGAWLEQQKVAGIYRAQRMGRVKMTAVAAPHDGIGVPYYAWSTSPLRRYVDLFNQRQIIATVKGEKAPIQPNDSDLFATISGFESNYTLFNDFQDRMNRYWSMRWLDQEKIKEVRATVVKGDLVRFEGLPMLQRIPGLPELPRGQSVLLQIRGFNYLDLVMETSLSRVLEESQQVMEEEVIEDIEQIAETGKNQSTNEQT